MQIFFLSLIVFLLGLAMLVYGHRIFLVMLPVWGFFAGFWLGGDVTSLILGSGFLGTTTGWVVGFVLGLVFAIFSYQYYSLAVAFQAAIVGYGLGSGLIAAFLGPGVISALIGLLFGVVILVFAFAFNLLEILIIVITSFLGANAMMLSVFLFFGLVSLQSIQTQGTTIISFVENSWLWLLAWIALAGVGVGSQMDVNRNFVFRKETYLEGWG